MYAHEDDVITVRGRGDVMHEPKAVITVRVRHIKTRSPAKCVINIL